MYRSCRSFILGCTEVMAFMERLCLMERGIIPARTMTVKRMIAMPKLAKKAAYKSTRLLIMGRMITPFQISLRISMSASGPVGGNVTLTRRGRGRSCGGELPFDRLRANDLRPHGALLGSRIRGNDD